MRLLFLFVLFFSQVTFAHDGPELAAGLNKGLCDFPVPAYRISEFVTSGISKSTFNALMNEIEQVYTPIFKKYGCTFVLHRSWSDGTVNAQAWQEGIRGLNLECHVEMFGGLARYPGMSKGAMRKVALHEIGHHLGGVPFYPGENLSCEGQADYYAGAVYHSPASDLRLTGVLADLEGVTKPWRPGPTLPAVRSTFCSHPDPQCRLFSYDNGRLGKPRPLCWYKP